MDRQPPPYHACPAFGKRPGPQRRSHFDHFSDLLHDPRYVHSQVRSGGVLLISSRISFMLCTGTCATFSPVHSEMRCWGKNSSISSRISVATCATTVCSRSEMRCWGMQVLDLLKDHLHDLPSKKVDDVPPSLFPCARKNLAVVCPYSAHDKGLLLDARRNALLWNIRDLLKDLSRQVRYKRIHHLLSCALESVLGETS